MPEIIDGEARDVEEENIVHDPTGEDYEGLSEDLKAILDREPNVPDGPPHFKQNGTEHEISQPNKYKMGPKRTITEREADLVIIAKLYLGGMNHHQIAAELTKLRGYTIKTGQVSMDIHAIYKRWMESYLSDYNRLKVRELAKIDRLEAEYWTAWEASKTDKMAVEQIKTADQVPQGKSGDLKTSYQRTKTTTKKERRDPNTVFLQGIQWCIEQRCKIFGLNAPTTVNINWRKQAEEAGYNPDELLDSLTEQFISAARSGGSGNPRSLGSGAEEA